METGKTEGVVDDVAGKVEDAAGGITGDSSAQLAGKAREFRGKAEQLCADTCAMLRDATVEKPLTTLTLAALAGFVVGLVWRAGDRR
ncbi:CsbD family protein [Paraburkholderia sp. GAS334]|jgi:uncharacterized protein YjbJ (UPF0337 family)|uniref:CsbD family protein n=1 Tax=unclassified Paraburkholderia TaxID=2615204 RepID=UPI003D1B6367